jgi:ankyrin repeat protein
MVTIKIPKKEKYSIGNSIRKFKSNTEDIIKQIEKEILFLAISQDNLNNVKNILEKGVDVNVILDEEFKITGLMKAAGQGHLEIVKLLLEKKADVNLFNELGGCALHSACFGDTTQHLQIAEELIKHGTDVNIVCGYDNSTPLMNAAQYGNLDMVLLLIRFGADVYIRNCYNQTAYNCALFSGHTRVAEKLLSFDLSEEKITTAV